MQQPEDAPRPRPIPASPAAATSDARGDGPRAAPGPDAQAALDALDALDTLPEPAAPETSADAAPVQPGALATAAGLAALVLPRRASALPAGWMRRAVWVALVSLLVLLPVAQWGAGKDDLYAAAAAARAAWRYDRALEFYGRIARLDPSDPQPHCQEGQVLALQQLYAQAEAAYTTCERLGERGPNTWLAQGDAAQSAGDLSAAEHDWLRAAAAGSLSAHGRLASLYEQEGRLAEAAAQWQALGRNDAQAQVHLGLLALQAGDYAAARAAFVAARSLPGFSGQEAVDQGFVTLAALPPEGAKGLAVIGGAFVQADMPTLARQPLETAVALDPGYGPAHAYLAWVRLAAGQLGAAETEAAAAVRLAPGESFGWFVAAQVALEQGRWSTAVSDAQAGIERDNHNPVLWETLGSAYLGQRDYVNAELSLEEAAQLGPEPVFTMELLEFYVTHRVGVMLDRAGRAALVAMTRFPANAQVTVLAGEAYELAGNLDMADAAYLRANTLDPSLPEPYFYLGRIALNAGDYVQAHLALSTYLALRPGGDLAEQARTLIAPMAGFDL